MTPPRLVFWETTTGCNLECRHCRRLEVSKALSKQDLSTEQVKRFILDGLVHAGPAPLADHGFVSQEASAAVRQMLIRQRCGADWPVLVFSGGEPLFRPDLFELAAYAVERKLPIALATNGTLVDEGVAARVAQAGFERVSVSLDGADAATHDAFRGQIGAFQKAVDGLDRLRRLGMDLQVNTTVTRHNVGQLEGIYETVVGLGVKAWHLFMFVPVGCGLEIPPDEQLVAEQYESVLKWLASTALASKIFVRATCAPQYYRILAQSHALKRFQHGSKLSVLTKGCLAGTGICFISHTGEVFPCGYLPVSCGNVCRQPFADIWENSPIFGALRDPAQLSGKCGICPFKNLCSGCRARAFAAGGDYLAEEPCCTYEPVRVPP